MNTIVLLACSSALGMQDGRIKDCQISGSPGHKVHVPKNARKGGSDGEINDYFFLLGLV